MTENIMNMIEYAKSEVKESILKALGVLVSKEKISGSPLPAFVVEIPNDSSHGDFSCNIALVSSKTFGMKPRDIAELITGEIELIGTIFNKTEIAGPGFINFFVGDEWFAKTVNLINQLGKDYGKTNLGGGKRVLVEFVSANPTGPMHIGNARGGALGDCLSSVLETAGFYVEREFYVNDTGNQVRKLGLSLDIRYRQHFGESIEMPEDSYHGADIIDRVNEFIEIYGNKYIDASEEDRKNALVDYVLPKNIKALEDDLLKYRIKYDTWFRESTLTESGLADEVIEKLKERNCTYESEGALWFKASEYGADKDIVLIRSNGLYTYIVPDIAYHYNKLVTRNFDIAIDCLGADHHGYVQRMTAVLKALDIDVSKFKVVICQMVRLVRAGETVKLSKRSGKAITLATLLDEVPIDAARFVFNMRDPNTHLDFDLDLAIEESSKNPVYYVEYAHARICSIIRKLHENGVDTENIDFRKKLIYSEKSETEMIKKIAQLPEEINQAAKDFNPSRLTKYVFELAQLFHKFYDTCRIAGENENIMVSRLYLCMAVKVAIKNVLDILKVEAPEKM